MAKRFGWVLVAGVLLLGGGPAGAQAKKSDSKVKITATAGKPGADGKQVVTITLAVDKGWYVYANPVGAADLESIQTTVKVGGKAKIDSVKVDYPKGKAVKDKDVGVYHIYEDKVDIKATVRRARGDEGALEVTVKLQACSHKGVCLLPAEVKVPVK
jgi:DsbC/DsbD-like thiol-disulfide interchange protein